ncbi:MAG TPA: hypothetical protein VG871_15210 [Vicinamibacterales bacterium]|nr:hypothetical protein [Vicinamibacterales bacterium]
MKHVLRVVITSVVAIGAVSLHAQQPAPAKPAAAKSYAPPKTSWGDPDISGVWTSDAAIGIPMQRPDKYGDRGELTDAEFAEKEKADAERRKKAEDAIGSFRNDNAWLNKSYRQTSLIVDPPDGKMPAVTPWAESRRATRDRGTFGFGPFNSPEDFTMYDRCITRGIVGSVLPVVYGNGNRIMQAPGEVIISYEMVHDTRVIYTDGRPHVGRNIRELLGDSRGHWEGATLVVETTNLTDKTSIGLNGNGLRHSADMVMTERITRVAPDELRYEVTMNDPKTYVKPFTISLPLTSPPGYKLLPYECLEGDYAVKNALSAERVEDDALAADLKRGIVRPRKAITQDNVNQPRPTE